MNIGDNDLAPRQCRERPAAVELVRGARQRVVTAVTADVEVRLDVPCRGRQWWRVPRRVPFRTVLAPGG